MIFSTGDFGRFLRCWREHRNLTREEVCRIPGIDAQPRAINLAENGVFWEAQQRLARLFLFEIEPFEAEELREITDPEALSSALYRARVGLRLSVDLVSERTGLSAATITQVESKATARAVVAYLAHALNDTASNPDLLRALVTRALAPWYWQQGREGWIPRVKASLG